MAKTPDHLRPFVKSKNGPLFIALNVLRALSILALLLVLASNVVTIVDDSKAIKAARKIESNATSSPVFSTSAATVTITPSASPKPAVLYVTVAPPVPTQAASPVSPVPQVAQPVSSVQIAQPAPSVQVARLAPSVQVAARQYTPPATNCSEDEWQYEYDDSADKEWISQLAATSSPNNLQHSPPAAYYVEALPASDNATSNITINNYCNYIRGSTVPLQTAGAFWSILNRIFIIFEAILLVLAELCIPQRLFSEYIPMLGPSYGLGTLGVLQGLIASSVLSHHSQLFPQVSAWLLFIVGCANIMTGIFFREKAKSIRALFKWENSEEATPQTPGPKPITAHVYDWYADYEKKKEANASRNPPSPSSIYSSTTTNRPPTVIPGARFGGFSFGRQAEQGKPYISHPTSAFHAA